MWILSKVSLFHGESPPKKIRLGYHFPHEAVWSIRMSPQYLA